MGRSWMPKNERGISRCSDLVNKVIISEKAILSCVAGHAGASATDFS